MYSSALSTEEQDNYYLLCDVLPEDRILREELQKQKLVRILKYEQCIRSTHKNHSCYFFHFYLREFSNIHKIKDYTYMS